MSTTTQQERAADRITELLDDLRRRIISLERGPRLSHASIEGEPLDVFDDDQVLRQTIGAQPDGTYTVVDVNGPPPPTPTAPVITERPGVLVVAWDGLFTGGAFAPLDLDHVEVHVWTTPGYVPDEVTEIATIYSGRGESVTLALDEGVTYYVKLVAVSTSGTESTPSVEVAATPLAATTGAGGVQTFHEPTAPVGLTADDTGALWYDTDDGNHPYRWNGTGWVSIRDATIAAAQNAAAAAQADADQAIADAADAQATADGKVASYFQAAAPTGLGAADVGDLWFDTDDGNKMYRWDGTQWLVSQDTAITEALNDAAAAQTAAGNAQATADTKIVTLYQATAPAGTGRTTGDLWVDTDDGNHLYRWSGTAWASVRDAGIAAASAAASDAQTQANNALSAAQAAQATADNAIRTYYSATPPWADNTAQPPEVLGDLWYDTDTDLAHRWDGTVWQPIQDNAISQALATAQNAQTTADGKITAYYQTTAPATAEDGDLWYDTDNGNKGHYWNAGAWQQIPVGTGALVDGAITTPKIGDGQVTSVKIASLDAGKVTTGTLDVSGAVTIYSDLGTDTDSRLLIDTTGLVAYDDAGRLTVNLDSSGKMAVTGSFTTSTVPNEAQIDIGDLAGTGSNKTFIHFYVGDERDAAGVTLSGYAPGKIESGLSGLHADVNAYRYLTFKAPNDPTRSIGTLELRSSNANYGDRPTLLWTGDIKLTGSRAIIYAGTGTSDRKRMDLIGSQIWMDIPNGTMRVDDGSGVNRLVSRNFDDTALRDLSLYVPALRIDYQEGWLVIDSDGTGGTRLRSRNQAGDRRNFTFTTGPATWDFADGALVMRGGSSIRAQLYNGASGEFGTGLSWNTGYGLRVTSQNYDGAYRSIAASAFNVNSDPTRKSNVAPVTLAQAINTIRNLRAYEYNYEGETERQRGLMATDVRDLDPVLVHPEDVGKPTNNIDLYGVITTLVVVCQEAVRRITAVEAEARRRGWPVTPAQ